MQPNFKLPGRQRIIVQGKPLARTIGVGCSPFNITGRRNGFVQGKPLGRTAGIGDTPWYVPGMLRRRGAKQLEVTLTYGIDTITYEGLELTYTHSIS